MRCILCITRLIAAQSCNTNLQPRETMAVLALYRLYLMYI